MQENLVVHIAVQPWAWFLTDRAGRVVRQGQGSPPADEARQTTALVDMADCLPLTVDLPALSSSKLQQALPWAVEEQIAGNVEDQHVVAVDRDSEGRVLALVVAREALDRWIEELEQNGVRADRMVPDALCLPPPTRGLHMLRAGERILLRSGQWSASSLEEELASELAGELASPELPPVWYGPEAPGWLTDCHAEVLLEPGGREILVEQALASNTNLLQGAYAPVSARQNRKLWVAAGVLAVVLVASQFLYASIEHWQLKRQSAELQTTIEEQYREVFPDAGRVVAGRERELAERELARLRYGEAAGLIDLLSRTVPVLSGAQATRVRSLDYRDGQLEIRLTADGVSDLDQLERRLEAIGLHARVQSASLGPDGADGRLSIRQVAP